MAGAEGKIRRGIVEADLFEAIVGSGPQPLLRCQHTRRHLCAEQGQADGERGERCCSWTRPRRAISGQGKAQNYIDPEHIGKIVEAYKAIFEDVERFAHVADLEEIQSNDFNLNISRYVDTTEPVEVMPVEEALAQLREAERRRDEAVARMDELLAEMGYAR